MTKSGVLFTGDQRGRVLALDARPARSCGIPDRLRHQRLAITYELERPPNVAILSGLGGASQLLLLRPQGACSGVLGDGSVSESSKYSQ